MDLKSKESSIKTKSIITHTIVFNYTELERMNLLINKEFPVQAIVFIIGFILRLAL